MTNWTATMTGRKQRTMTARADRGPCSMCKLPILKGDRYMQWTGAWEDEAWSEFHTCCEYPPCKHREARE